MLSLYDEKSLTVHLEDLVGGALSLYSAALIKARGGVHVFVAEDRDTAAYMLNDFYALLDEQCVHFFPTSYKKSILYGKEDAQGLVQRTNTLNAIRRGEAPYIVVCTYPEALAERVADAATITGNSIRIAVGDKADMSQLEQQIVDRGFTQVDFVYEPGQYSMRGGILDVFSFAESRPYRIDFFGDTVDSIRLFNISSQLSSDKVQQAEIIPNLNSTSPEKVSLARFAGKATYWFYDADYILRRVNDLRRRLLSEMEEPVQIDSLMTSRNILLEDMRTCRLYELRDNIKERPAVAEVRFATAPQPKFNKKFDVLADDITASTAKGYRTYILSENKAQIERLDNIFHQTGHGNTVIDTANGVVPAGAPYPWTITKLKSGNSAFYVIYSRNGRFDNGKERIRVANVSVTTTETDAFGNSVTVDVPWNTDPQFLAQKGFKTETVPSSYGFTLSLTPVVAEKTTQMDIDIRNESLIGWNSDGTPRISRDTGLRTRVMMNNSGETFVIGGLSKRSLVTSDGGIPWLKKLPILGYLFSTESQATKSSRLILVLECAVVDTLNAKLDDATAAAIQKADGKLSGAGVSIPYANTQWGLTR